MEQRTYHEQTTIQNTKRLRELISDLPSYVATFFVVSNKLPHPVHVLHMHLIYMCFLNIFPLQIRYTMENS